MQCLRTLTNDLSTPHVLTATVSVSSTRTRQGLEFDQFVVSAISNPEARFPTPQPRHLWDPEIVLGGGLCLVGGGLVGAAEVVLERARTRDT